MILESTGSVMEFTSTGSFVDLHQLERSTGVSEEGAIYTTRLVLPNVLHGKETIRSLSTVIDRSLDSIYNSFAFKTYIVSFVCGILFCYSIEAAVFKSQQYHLFSTQNHDSLTHNTYREYIILGFAASNSQ